MQPILVVDDDYEIREMLVMALAEQGCSAVAVEHGLAALTYLDSDAPEPGLIILDMMMPVMNGAQCWQALRTDPVWRTIPVVLVSAGIFLQQAAHALPVVGVLPKPIPLDRLYDLAALYCR